MKGLMEFCYLILIVGVIFIILMLWNAISIMFLKHKFSNVVACLKKNGYRYYGRYKAKGNGIIFSKLIDKELIDSLLFRYKYSPIELDGEYKIIDYAAIVKFPELEERYPSIVRVHGGIRLFHFYAIKMNIGSRSYQRCLDYYLDCDMGGEPLDPIFLEDKDIIESILSSSIRYAIRKFNDDEIKYWIYNNKIK